jgi:hypothetical protein
VTEIIDGPGTRVYHDKESDRYSVYLDSDAMDSIHFFEDLKARTGAYDGFALADLIMDLKFQVNHLNERLLHMQCLHEDNPAVKAAWDHYQTMLALASEGNNQ